MSSTEADTKSSESKDSAGDTLSTSTKDSPATVKKEACAESVEKAENMSVPDNSLEEEKQEEELVDAERRIMFTDAVVAIALTLLILPLMEAASDVEEGNVSTAEWFRENRYLLISFLLSFAVIASFWRRHDRLFRYVGRMTWLLTILNGLWLLGIVFLPVATALVNNVRDDLLQHVCYIGTMLFIKFISVLMAVEVYRNPRTWKDEKRGPSRIYSVWLCRSYSVRLGAGLVVNDHWIPCTSLFTLGTGHHQGDCLEISPIERYVNLEASSTDD